MQNNGYQVRGLPGSVISLAQERFATTFDLDLREVKRLAKRRPTGKSAVGAEATASVSGTYYILVSLLPDDLRRRFLKQEDVRMERAFTMVVLSLIYVRPPPGASPEPARRAPRCTQTLNDASPSGAAHRCRRCAACTRPPSWRSRRPSSAASTA